ncbi:MAG: TatD family hydrolase [FCB group bacterium]|jgi:TatD DNase family protein|nr:TatD family hydrolase [FCB group bacterium]
MRLADTHCHLQSDAFDTDREEVLERALDVLEFIVVVGDDLENSRKAVDLCRDRVHAVVGYHPYHAEVAVQSLDALRELLPQSGIVALGEIGLDYFHKYAPEEAQHAAFRRQLELAVEASLPVVIHSRDAEADTLAILREYASSLPGGIMHCFPGGAEFAEQCLALGFHISFAGNVTFPKAVPLREAAAVVPLDRLLVETDSPYLAPQPVRGKRCEPACVQHTAQALAALKGISYEAFADATTQNAKKIFRIT